MMISGRTVPGLVRHGLFTLRQQHRLLRTSPILLYDLQNENHFARRHIGPRKEDVDVMLKTVNCKSLDELIDKTIPNGIRLKKPMKLPLAVHEHGMLEELRGIANMNQTYRSYIGMGYYGCITPSVIVRQMLENAGWITQYTPYQPEISQGRLESLMNYQTMVCDLTGLHAANASLLDESTACAEAMTLCHRAARGKKNVFLVDQYMHEQNLALIRTRSEPLGIEVRVQHYSEMQPDENVCGVIVQYPNTYGTLTDHNELVKKTKQAGGLFVMCTDLLACTLIKCPGEYGADIAIGSAQRFGVPIGFGGPHAAFMSVRDDDNKHKLTRMMPGRMVGVTKDAQGKQGYRLALQTREQHIRREKATSNICTAQALLANMAAMYGVYHGPEGLREIAMNTHRNAVGLVTLLKRHNKQLEIMNSVERFFDTICVRVPNVVEVHERAIENKLNFRYYDDGSIGIALDETVEEKDVHLLANVLCGPRIETEITMEEVQEVLENCQSGLISGKEGEARQTKYLEHPVFNTYHSEQQLVRYMKKLENKDVSLCHSMIPLGSCTMKLNSSSELIPVSWPQFNSIHPFAPRNQSKGYDKMINDLETWLCEITGYDRISFQPNSGAQGEYAGLLAIRQYLHSIDQKQRDVCLIPNSAHGTNPASAQMAGYKIDIVGSDKTGAIDVVDLKNKIEKHGDRLSAIMVTYPSTFGVFDEPIAEVCEMVHAAGGQVYLDGANLNAQVGLCRPGDYGSDVSHLNLHKTFCIPHGGGGPGMGPIGVKSHLAPFLPKHPLVHLHGCHGPTVSAAPWGSTSILPITWAYIRMMGAAGLKLASQIAVLNANYCMQRVNDAYQVEYKGRHGFVSHEFIMDCRPFKKATGITVNDIAKRMMDYGFHAPTMSWPVPDCLMMEPTESEDKGELDRYCDALISIRNEIQEIQSGKADKNDNVIINAPHTLDTVTSNDWTHSYTRQQAAYPKDWCRDKHWPTVGRIDDVFGDKNLVCTCPPIESYM